MPMIWSPEANVKILLGILEQHKQCAFKLDYNQLAVYMGPECTPKSLIHQIAKLKKQAGEDMDTTTSSTAPSNETANVTPRKRRAPTKGKATATPSKKGKGKDHVQNVQAETENERDGSEDAEEEEDNDVFVKRELED